MIIAFVDHTESGGLFIKKALISWIYILSCNVLKFPTTSESRGLSVYIFSKNETFHIFPVEFTTKRALHTSP